MSRKWTGTVYPLIKVEFRFKYLGSTPRLGEVRKPMLDKVLRSEAFQYFMVYSPPEWKFLRLVSDAAGGSESSVISRFEKRAIASKYSRAARAPNIILRSITCRRWAKKAATSYCWRDGSNEAWMASASGWAARSMVSSKSSRDTLGQSRAAG